MQKPSIFINDGKEFILLGGQEFQRYKTILITRIKDLNSDGYPDIVLVQESKCFFFNDGTENPQIARSWGMVLAWA